MIPWRTITNILAAQTILQGISNMFFARDVYIKGIAGDHIVVYLFYQCGADSAGERHGELFVEADHRVTGWQ